MDLQSFGPLSQDEGLDGFLISARNNEQWETTEAFRTGIPVINKSRGGCGIFTNKDHEKTTKRRIVMANDKKLVEAITSMDVDLAQWYTDGVKKAELCDYASV